MLLPLYQMVKYDTTDRDRELCKRYDDIIKSGINHNYLTHKNVVKVISLQSAPRFYLEPRTAEKYILQYYRGEYYRKSVLGRKMIDDLVANYERLASQHPNWCNYQLWDAVVMCEAKSFYLTENTIKFIIYGYLRKKRQ